MSEDDIAKASQVKNQLSEEAIREKVRDSERKKQIAADERAKLKGGGDLTSGVSEEGKTLLQRLGIAGKYLPFFGAAYTAPESYRAVKKATESITGPGILPTIAGRRSSSIRVC